MLEPEYTITQEAVQLSGARPVAVKAVPHLKQTIRPHDHAYFELTIVTGGEGGHHTERGFTGLRRGSILVLAPEEVHGYDLGQRQALELWNIYYLAEWLLADLPILWDEPHLVDLFLARQLFPRHRRLRIPEFTLDEKELAATLSNLETLETELQRPHPSLVYLKSCFFKLLVDLARPFSRSATPSETLAFRPEVWQLIHRIDALLKRGEPFDLAAEAESLHLTRDHLSRLFKEATGQTAIAYYQARRIQEACFRLLNPKITLTELAYALNFADSAHFSRSFRNHKSMSPSEYQFLYGFRKNLREPE